jgi:drug/metabolite transporter (DMT)-like permease
MITSASLTLVILSAIIHPLWNMLLKTSEDKVTFYLNIHLIFTLLFCFILFIYPLGNITVLGWAFILFSALSHFFYQVFLCQTYELGDMSLTYPVVRSSPVFVMIFGSFFLKELPSFLAILGILLVIYGGCIINQREFSISQFVKPFKILHGRAMLFAIFTALWSAIYSVVDKKGVLNMSPVLFFYMFFTISGFLFLGYFLFLKEKRKNYLLILKKNKYKIILAAILEFSSYILILYAFRMSKVAYIVALRQISIIFGAIFGIIFLKEHYGRVRVFASCIIFAGAFLIIAFG